MSALKSRCAARTWACAAIMIGLTAAGPAWGLEPKHPVSSLDALAFAQPELVVTSTQVPLDDLLEQLPSKTAWNAAPREDALGAPLVAFIDPRSGAATNILGAFPLLPGSGKGNRVTLTELGARLGRTLRQLDDPTVGALVTEFVTHKAGLLGIEVSELGPARVGKVSDDLWQITFTQQSGGVPVRDARLAVTINHGNVVTFGTQGWGRVTIGTRPALSASQAVEAGFTRVGGRALADDVVVSPHLEIVPMAAAQDRKSEAFDGPVGQGYAHRLVWAFSFRRAPESATWEVLVSADSGEVLALADTNSYVTKQVVGGVYPLTDTGVCLATNKCGAMQNAWPMPFADTGQAAPNDFANSAGVFIYGGGAVNTTLTGKFFGIADNCGAISEGTSGAGPLDLAGANGDHDCTAAGQSPGNTAASRSAFYELNKIAEQGRGWLPNNNWLKTRVTANVNIDQTCNAFWSSEFQDLNFYKSGGSGNGVVCRNTGEIAGVFDHEWGHGLDDNDAGGSLSNSSEAYADIAAVYRLNTSCIGHGFLEALPGGGVCGLASDGTPNRNEDQLGPGHCDTDCSGVRDADYLKHADGQPDTALGFVCSSCGIGTGPCGRQVHCAAAPARQAAWDLVARDLRQAPFYYGSETALLIGTKLFYQGSGAIGAWHSCACGASSSGCGSTNGYVAWLAADDDDGNLANGTPHMTALYNAFNRHGIACSLPTPVNSGCSGAPVVPPSVTATASDNAVVLTWTAAAGAQGYWVFRTEGHAGCSLGKALVAKLSAGTLKYIDKQVANGRTYYYNVVAKGSSDACYSMTSPCRSATPGAGLDGMVPEVAITTPSVDLEIIAPSLSVTATASDDVGVTKVELFVNNVKVATMTTPPYVHQINTLATGTYALVAKAHDAFGHVGVSATRLVEKLPPLTALVEVPAQRR